jgi:hypothetical protein
MHACRNRLPYGTPFHQTGTWPREGIIVVIGTYPQCVAEPSGPFRDDIFGKTAPSCCSRNATRRLGFFQVPGIHATDHHLRANVVGSQTREVDGRTHCDGPAADQRTTWSGPASTKRACSHTSRMRAFHCVFRGSGIVRLPHAQMAGSGRARITRSYTREPCGGIEGRADVVSDCLTRRIHSRGVCSRFS